MNLGQEIDLDELLVGQVFFSGLDRILAMFMPQTLRQRNRLRRSAPYKSLVLCDGEFLAERYLLRLFTC